MSTLRPRLMAVAGILVAMVVGVRPLPAATVEEALSYSPVQKDAPYDRPSAKEIAECKIVSEKIGDATAWIVRGAAGQVLRAFLDSNADNRVDQWRYFQNGTECYRDMDTNFNGKADEFRWLGYGGSRWGVDRDEDGQIDQWKSISAEEVSFEAFAAVRDRDPVRLAKILISPQELAQLGVDKSRTEVMAEKLKTSLERFRAALAAKPVVDPRSEWVHFGATQPGVIPEGTDGTTKDIVVYENVSAMIESGGKNDQLGIGTLVQVPRGWRLIDIPVQLYADPGSQVTSFLQPSMSTEPEAPAPPENALSAETREVLAELAAAEKQLSEAKSPKDRREAYADQAAALRKLASQSKTQSDQVVWLRQLADTLSTAAQSGDFPEAATQLERLFDELSKQAKESDLTAYVQFRLLLAKYSLAIQVGDANFGEIQEDWLKQLAEFVETYPKSEDAPEAMWQLAMAEEFNGNDKDALAWCEKILAVANPESSVVSRKAAGAKRRLESVGQQLDLKGKTTKGESFDVQQLRGQLVLVHYWATFSTSSLTDMEELAKLLKKYSGKFLPVGVNVDTDTKQLTAFLGKNQLPWPQLFEQGGLDRSRLAVDLGVSSVPTMILLDTDGKVLDRNISIADLEEFLSKKLR